MTPVYHTYVAPVVSIWMGQFATRARRLQRRDGVASGGRECGTVLSRVFPSLSDAKEATQR